MMNFLSKINRLVIALMGVLVLTISNANAGTAYTNGRAFLKQGSPTGGGKVYVANNGTTPAASAYKAVTSSTSPAFNVQVDGNATFHYWAVANAGYIFTGWYDANGVLQSSGAAHFSKAVTAGQAGASDTHAYADYYASFIKQIQLSFVTPTNGSFTITHCGSEVTPAYSSFTTEGKVVLTALPADGYKLRGWYTTTNGGKTKNYFAFGNSCEPNFTSNTTIGAEFVPDDGKATFWIKGTNKIFNDLNSANTAAAAASSKMIVVVSDGIVGAGTYTISSGVTLLIPYEETYTLMTKPNVKHITSASAAARTPSIFRKLTLASGATINVSGNICIGGSIASVNGGSPSSFPTGPVGMLDLSRGGTINLQSNSNLYAWGYVKGQDMDQGNNTAASGVGEINAASNATVWEDYQVGEWRGGTASSTIYNNKGSWKFFPFQSYTVQNIEAPVNYAYGSNLKCFWTIFGNGSVYEVNFPLIASDKSLFKLANASSSVRKWYDPTTDHVCFEMGGTAALDALTLSVMGETVSSSDYYLPIPANLKIILKSGNNLTVSNPMTMHAGSVVEVKSGATLTVNKRVHLFDADDWDTYCMYKYYYRTYFSPSLHFNRGEGTAKTNLEDATVIVDGTVDVKGAYLYSSAHGSNICGNGGGTFIYAALPSNTTMTQCKELKDNVSVNIRSANLHNDNGTYTKGIASTTFKNINGRWFTNAASTIKANKTYDFTYIKSGDVYGTGGTNATVAACWSKDKTGLALQNKWANIKAEGCTDWWTGIDDTHLYNWTRNSAWHQYIKTGTIGEGEEKQDVYAGSDDKLFYKFNCDITEEGAIDGNCLYTVDGVKKALVNGAFVAVTANGGYDHGYHATADASSYYLCFDGCVWHPATRNAENLYTVDGTKYIWYDDKWMAVEYDSGVSLYYSLSATNVKIYYEYVGSAWVLATPVAEVVTSAGTEQVFSIANAITKAKAGGTNVTIRLLKNISGTISYDGANNCGLDLNGFTLSSSSNNMITVNHASANFIIKDQSAAGTGKIEAEYSSSSKINGLKVTKGHIILNSGTVHVKNTHATAGATGVTVVSGYKFTINGGTLEVESKGETWGVYTESSTTSVVTVNGGTIDASTTSASGDNKTSAIYGLGGNIIVNGGTLNGRASATYARGIYLNSASPKLTINGGTITATAPNTIYGLHLIAGATATVNDGTITATATGGTVRGILSYGTLTMNGGTVNASAGGSDSRALFLRNNTSTINAGTVINATAASNAYGIYYDNGTPTVTVNNGTFTVSTTSTTGSYGVYAAKGTGTINDGTFTVTAKTTGAEGMHVETANTPKLTLNGGKFMVKNSDGAANGTINNTGATLANFSMAGGYFNVAPNGTTNIAAGKSVKDVSSTKEKAIYDAGYIKKIAGNEYTVTWKNFDGSVKLGTSQVESGQVPVWTGERPDYKDATSEREWIGWATETWNRGTQYVNGTPLPAIATDVTYYAACQAIYADVTAGGTTTRYNSAQKAWTEAMKHKQATIRILSNLGSEASVGNMTELVFNPANEGSIITLDLNGHIWTMGNHSTAANNKNVFLKVSPSKANCKLIVTDNSASGNGYLMNKWACGENLICANVTGGELILQGGGLKVNNTNANYNAVGVQANGGVFTMTGGIVEAKKEGDAVTSGGAATGVYAYSKTTLSSGTINATHAKYQAAGIQVMRRNVETTLEDGLTVNVNGCQAFGVYGYGAVDITGGNYNVTATKDGSTWSTARGIYMTVSGENYGLANVTGNPTFTINGMNAASYGVYSHGNSNVAVNVDSGTFNVYATNASGATGVTAQAGGVATIKGGTFTSEVKTSGYENAFGVQVQEAGVVNVEGGTFTAIAPKDGGNSDAARINGSATNNTAQLNISGGSFTMTKGGYAVRSFGGTTHISGNPTFTARYGIDIGSWAAATCTATMVVDGGTFNATVGEAVRCYTTSTVKDAGKDTEHTDVVTGDLTIWDGKFHSPSSIKPVVVSATTNASNIKIRGGYYSSYTSSNVSNLTQYVVSPSTAEALASGTTEYTEGYRYRVNTKYNVTFSVNGVNTVKQYNRNETPSYGSTPTIDDGNYYVFNGWSPAIAPVTADVTYTAQFTKYEAEVYEGESTKPVRFEHFTDAWSKAQNLPMATIKLISNASLSTQLALYPDSAAGSKPLTLDLNNHTLQYTGSNDRFIYLEKTDGKLIIKDSSVGQNGQIKVDVSRDAHATAVAPHKGTLELQSGTIYMRNTSSHTDATSWGVYPCQTSSFIMTGGHVQAYGKKKARGIYTESTGTPTVHVSGGTILASTEINSTWGNEAYGIHAMNGSTVTISGTAAITAHANQDAYAVYAIGVSGNMSEVTIKGGSVNAIVETSRVFGAYAAGYGKINIEGGTVDGHSNTAVTTSMWNVEGAHCAGNAELNISGGTITSSNGASPIGVSVHGGTTTITGGTINSEVAMHVVDYAAATQTAIVNVFGGTFIGNKYEAVKVAGRILDGRKNNANVTINGGYFFNNTSPGHYITLENETGAEPSTLVLNGGYYNKWGDGRKEAITALKGDATTVTDINETVDGRKYDYKLSTPFAIHWRGGTSYSKDENILSGVVPSNDELVDKAFIRNDSTFYFTGWNPTPTYVTGETTYQAEGVYNEAKVTVSAQDSIFDNFDEAWAYAMDQASATITLLTNLTRTTSIIYNPTPANARHTLDLNNFTIKENTTDRLLIVNKTGAQLTITDNSSAKGGCLYKKMDSSANIHTSVIYHGELILAGGKLYVENTKDEKVWHPAECVHVSRSTDGIFTMTGGTVESQAKYLAYPLYNYATMNISGGTIIANATTQGAAQGLYAVAGTATISGGTWNISSTTSGAVGVAATGWVNTTGTPRENGVLNITGGTFNVSAATSNVQGFKSYAVGKRIDGTNYTARGIVNVSGGKFNVTCSAATATQVFAAQVDGWRLFDDATPHNLIGEERGEINISGGTFTVDTRDNGAWVTNGGNVDMLRCWGNLNVTGGNFTIYQNSSPSAIGVFRGKTTVSGNPVFNVYAHTNNAYAVCAGYWTHENYCDKNAANNLAEAEVNGGTFKIITEGQNTNVIYALGQISAESHLKSQVNPEVDSISPSTGTYIITAHAGYAMNAKITVNGGEFLGICPNESDKYPILLNSADDRVGTYGTAKSEIYVNGGKFKSRKGTEAENTATGAVNAHITGKILLTGGYYETNAQLTARKADTCDIVNITSAEIDPEYNNGYRYRIDIHYVAQVTATGVDRKFATFRGAFDYAKTLANSKITLLQDINYVGPYFYYNPSPAKSCTLDLNGFTFTGQSTGNPTTGADPDRLLIVSSAGATFTIMDSSVGKTGKFSHEKAGAGFSVIVYHGNFVLESGTVHCKNTSGSAQALRSTDPDAYITVTGGKVHAEATGTAYAINSYNTATVSGGLILAESSAGEAWGVNAQDAKGNISIQGNAVVKAIAYNSTAIGLRAAGGGQVTIKENACDTAISTTVGARGAYTENGHIYVQGNAKIMSDAQTSAYGVYLYSANAAATIAGGTITSKTHAGTNYSSFSVYPNSGASATITGGTFYAQTTGSTSNVSPVRTGPNATLTIDGGTFDGAAAQAVSIRGGTTTINGGTFTATTGIRAMDWADAATITGICVVNGGTFTTTGTTIHVSSKANNSHNAHSEVTINGGKFKSTGSTLVQMDATPDGADPSTLIIAGGYFYEKSGTTFKNQIAPFIADTSRINTLDPLYEGTYKYEVAPHYVASVTDGAVVTNYTTFKAAFDYAKTRNNSVVTLLDDCDFETNELYGYSLCPSGKTMTLDLNNHTVNATSTAYDRVFGLSGQLTITDHSGSKNGKLSLTQDYSSTFIGIVLNDGAKLILEEGTIYVENERASRGAEAINVWGTTGIFTQTGGLVHVKASGTAKAFQHRGTINIEGGEVRAVSTAGLAIGDSPAAEDPSTGKIGRSNISGTAHFNITGQTDANGVYNEIASNVSITGGTFDVTANTGNAYGIRAFANAATITVNGPVTINTTSTTAMAYSIHAGVGTVTLDGAIACTTTGATRARSIQAAGTATITVNNGTYKSVVTGSEADSYVIIPEGTSAMTVNGGKFHSNKNNIAWANTSAGATLTINGGYFNEYSTGTNHKTQVETYKADGKVVLNLDTDDAEYAAGYRYLVTADPVAKVKAGSEVTYHTTIEAAFEAANSSGTYDPTITLLRDASTTTTMLSYTGAKNCTLNLNGHTLSSTTAQALLYINTAGITFTITDLTESKSGGLNLESTRTDGSWCVYVANGNLQMDAGTVLLRSKANTYNDGIRIDTKASTFTMNGGKVHVVTSDSKPAWGIVSKGIAVISGGEIQVEASGTGYGIEARNTAGNVTVNGGKFLVTGTTAACAYRSNANATLKLQGGYYNSDTNLSTYCAANYHVLPNDDATYRYKVAEAYTLTWNLDGGTVTTAGTGAAEGATGTPSIVWGVGDDITAPIVTKTGYTFAGWSPVVAATMPAANTTYTATWTINSYTIRFLNHDGSVLQSGSVNYGETPVYSGSTPTKPADATYTYTFDTWSPAISTVTGAQDYTAQFSQTENVASVTVNSSGYTLYYTDFSKAFKVAKEATVPVTIKLLKDASCSEALVYNNNNTDCTLDLNGHTLTSNTSLQSPLHINKSNATFTITDGTDEKSGKLSMTSTYSDWTIFGAYAENGNLVLEAGTIEVISGSKTTCGVTVNKGTFTMNGGTIHVKTTNDNEGRGVYSAGTATVNGGTVHVEAAGAGYGIKRDGGTVTVNDGKFNITSSSGTPYITNQANNTYVKIYGGYYNINTQLGACVSAPYHVFDLTGESPYRYEVAEGYTLTWTTDGDPLTGTYTSGTTKVGTTIVAPSTPTKTGYTFSGWSPAVAATMPAANTTYTATWTVNTYTVTWKNADGTTLETDENVPYGTTPAYNGAKPQKATDAEYAYAFKTWSPAVSVVTGDAVYTATYTTTPVVASLTINSSGDKYYYTNFSTAFAQAQTVTAAVTITLLKDASCSETLVYNNNNTDCTLDLNGHTLTSTAAQAAVNIYKPGTTFTITDKTESKSGQIRIEATHTSEAYGLYVHAGHLKLEAGTIYASLAATTCAGVRAVTADASFTMDGGTIHVVTTNEKNGIGVMASNGTTVINGGTIQVEAAADGYGINRTGGTVTVDGGKFNISASGSAYATNLASANASVVIRGGYYTTNSQLNPTAPYHVFGLTSGAEYGEGYRYKVAEAYTLTWSTDGDALTGSYTSGMTAVGATITQPNTPTKANYVFAGWSPAVAGTMPAANTEYTATWTAAVASVQEGEGTPAYFATVAAAIEAANELTNPTVTMLQNASVDSEVEITAAMTIELNGKTVSSTITTTETGVFKINASGETVTIQDSGTGGKIDHTIGDVADKYVYGLNLVSGSLNITSGIIYAKNGRDVVSSKNRAYGIYAAASTVLTISGGTIEADRLTHKYAYGIESNGALTITGGTITAIGPAGYTYAVHETAGSVNISGGRFSSYPREFKKVAGTAAITGGYYVHNTEDIRDNCATNYHVFDLAGESPYLYEVAEGYTLTWSTDGDPLTGTYTSGTTKVGTTIVAPNTPTKTGYTFAGWSTTPAATMPAENTTYEATWTVNSYTIRFLNNDGTVLQTGSVNYGETPVYSGETPSKPADATYTYTFTGWSPAIAAVSGVQDYTAQFSQTVNVASVTVGGATTYYTTLQDAFNYAADKTTPTIQVLTNINISTTALVYTNTSKTTVTFDLNGYTVSGEASYLLQVTAPSNAGKFIIMDSRTGGQLYNKLTTNKLRQCVYAYQGTVELQSGTIYMENISTGASASAIGVNIRSSRKFTMTGGTVQAVSKKSAQAIYSAGTTTISGGNIIATENTSGTAIGIHVASGTTTISGTTVTVSGTTDARGVQVGGLTPALNSAKTSVTKYNGKANINGGTFSVTATASAGEAYGVYSYGNTAAFNYADADADDARGNFASYGTATITDGTFIVTASGASAKSYGVYVEAAASIQTATDAEGAASYAKATTTPKATISGGKFNVSGTVSYAMNTAATNARLVVQGGYYSTKRTDASASSNIEDKYTAPTKTGNYYCLSTTPADKASVGSDYNYKVAVAYTLTWNLDGGTVTTAGTGAAIDATGTPSIVWGVGDDITAPTVTKTGYTFAAWTPAVAATMPAANKTYTATWTPVAITFTGATNSSWNTASNWSPACVPTSAHDIYIQKPCSVDIEHAAAKSIVIRNGYSDYTGKLTVGSNMGLDVAGTITKTTNGSNSLATSESDLVLESSTAGNASLIFNNSNGDAATVQMYSKASVVDNTWNWQYVGTPFTGSIPLYNYYGSWMYKWNNGWDPVSGGDELTPFVGYCLTQANPTTHIMSGTLVATDTKDQTITMGASTDKVLANSWTAPISIASFTESTFTSTPATIYLFNTGSAENGSSEGEAAGTYITVPISSAPYTGNGLIAPMQGFFVTTVTGSAGKITMKYDELVRPAGSHTDIVAGPMKSPMRDREDFGEPDVMKISAKGSIYKDRVVILAREDFSEGFDNGWDGEKKGYNSAAPAVFVINEEGKNDAVSAIPEYEGTLVGFRAGTDNEYTLTFEYNGDEVLYLNDLKAQMSTVIANEQTYTFMTEDGDSEARFIISHTPIHKITTGIDEVVGGTKVRKIIINDKVYIIRNGRLYNVTGALVK